MMKKAVVIAAMMCVIPGFASAANSASIVSGSLVQGDVAVTMDKNDSSYQGGYGEETSNMSDWILHTGEFGWAAGTYGPVSVTNSNLNAYSDNWGSYGTAANTVIGFGNGGGVTLQFDNPISDVRGAKEFGLFTAQMLDAYGDVGGFWNGHMEAAILLSQNGMDWVTLEGTSVARDYTGSSYTLNAPTVAYDYGTLSNAWNYGTGATAAQLSALTVADYTVPMIDDSLFNDAASTNVMREAMASDMTTAGYDAVFGASGGGNWFDISGCGLDYIEYVQLNGVNCSGGGIRLDAVFTTDLAVVPEPATMLLLALGGLLVRSKKNKRNTLMLR